MMAENLTQHMNGVVQQLKEADRLIFKGSGEEEVVKVNISGDKGGGLMKFYYQISNIKDSSVFDVHMFTVFAA